MPKKQANKRNIRKVYKPKSGRAVKYDVSNLGASSKTGKKPRK